MRQGSASSAPPATATRRSPTTRATSCQPIPAEYREQVLRLREEYAGRMEVLLGIEQDSRSAQPVPDWADYWIGSVHNLYDPKTGKYHGIDWDRERLIACRDQMFGGDMLALTEGYYRDVAAMADRRPAILGHIDLVTKLNRGNALFDEDDPRCRTAALEALHHTDPDATLLEVNTGRHLPGIPGHALSGGVPSAGVAGHGRTDHPHRRRPQPGNGRVWLRPGGGAGKSGGFPGMCSADREGLEALPPVK